MIIKRDESYLSLLMVSKSELFYSYFLIFFSGYLFIYLFTYLFMYLFCNILHSLFRISFIWIRIN